MRSGASLSCPDLLPAATPGENSIERVLAFLQCRRPLSHLGLCLAR